MSLENDIMMEKYANLFFLSKFLIIFSSEQNYKYKTICNFYSFFFAAPEISEKFRNLFNSVRTYVSKFSNIRDPLCDSLWHSL